MTLTQHLRAAGTCLVLLALLHAFFPARFKWKEEAARLSPLNAQIFLVHSFFIAVTLVFFGVLSFVLAGLSAPTTLSRVTLAGFTVFWLLRLLVQLFVYDARLWRGSSFNTAVHVTLTAFWAYLATVYGIAVWGQTPGS